MDGTFVDIAPLENTLLDLQRHYERGEIGGRAVTTAVRIVADGIEELAPRRTGRLANSIASRRLTKAEQVMQLVAGKAGINVLSKAEQRAARLLTKNNVILSRRRGSASSQVKAPHGHLVALGTGKRFTKGGKYRGEMPANDFARRGAMSRLAAVENVLIDGVQADTRSVLRGEGVGSGQ